MPSFRQSLIAAQGDGSPLTGLVATSLLPAGAKLTVPANYIDYIGRTFHIKAAGRISNIVTTPGTLTLDLRLGATVVFSGGAMQLSTTAHTNVPWVWEVDMTVRAVGSAANFMSQGRFYSQAASLSAADSTATHSMLLTPNSAPAVGSNFDATVNLVLDLFATWSISNAGNTITLHQYEVESNVLY